jgi:hypothetical protein
MILMLGLGVHVPCHINFNQSLGHGSKLVVYKVHAKPARQYNYATNNMSSTWPKLPERVLHECCSQVRMESSYKLRLQQPAY